MDFKGQKSTPYIVDILHQHGVEHVVVCPGSRNAPLTLAFARHGKFNCLSVVDERSAGYLALGLSKSVKKPVAVICTSGTAVLNLAPAIAEAFHQHVPLIVLTADRPDAWIHQQDGQAIEQKNIYSNFIARSYSLRGELYHRDDLWMTERLTNEAMHIAHYQSRPVHINLSFSEPLYDEAYEKVQARKVDLKTAISHFADWKSLLDNKKNMLVVLGQMDYNQSIIDTISAMTLHPTVVFAAENLSNVFLSPIINNASEVISFFNDTMKPHIIVYVGGPVVSKQFKRFISSLKVPVIRIQENVEEVDTFQGNIALVNQSPANGLRSLADYICKRGVSLEFCSAWQEAGEKARKKRNDYLGQLTFSDLKVFEFIAKNIPEKSVIHFGNSTPVRYGQIFNDLYAKDCEFYANRGTSGIDGSTSTVIGFSNGDQRTHFLITGDLAFQYDSNAFFNRHLNGRIKIIVINNSGGNIFRVIDGPREQTERNEFFETSTTHEFSHLSKHFNLNYFSAKDEKELNSVWKSFVPPADRPSILEIFTDAELSATAFKEFYKKIQS